MIVINGKTDGWIGGYYIGRTMPGRDGSALANPFKTKEHTIEAHNRVVAEYRAWLWERIKEGNPAVCNELNGLLNAYNWGCEIKLACWCKPLPCHGDVIKACIEWAAREDRKF